MTEPTRHPEKARLTAFGLGQAAETEADAIAAHIGTCQHCRDTVDTQPDDALVSLVRRTVTKPPQQIGTDSETWIPSELLAHPRYRLEQWLGAGGMGVVYRAEHRLMERPVALKVINKGLTSSKEMVERFEREVKAAAKLSHPNIVAAYDAEHAGDLHFLAMEFIEGINLARLVEERGPLPMEVACDYVRQVAFGLQHAWQHGLVHRDIKPHNLMLTSTGQVKILDFGLAAFKGTQSSGPLTGLNQGLGTPDYVAPEQIRDARSADIRADIYSLGCTLYFLLTGQPPFPEGSASQKIAAHLERTPRQVTDHRSDLPNELGRIVTKMLAKSPEQRYQAPIEVVEALSPFSGTDTTKSPRSKLHVALLAAVAIVVASVFIGFSAGWFSSPAETGKPPESIASGNIGPSPNASTKKEAPSVLPTSKFSDVVLEKPFDKYLLASPLLMEIAGVKVIRFSSGNQMVISVASTAVSDDSSQERLRAERVCRIKAMANIVAEKEGVHVYRLEDLTERQVVTLTNDKETGKSISELLEVTQTKVEGVAKGMQVVGRWRSSDGKAFFLAIGQVIDPHGNPVSNLTP